MARNDMAVDQLILNRETPRILSVTQEWYDLLHIKDPYTIYVITDAKDRRVYHGDVLVVDENKKPVYFLTITEDEYQIYVNYRENYIDRLIHVGTYTDVNVALEDLARYNKIGSHTKWATQAHHITCLYIKKEISLQEFLIGMFSVFEYKDHPMVQALIAYAISMGVNMQSNEPCMELVEDLPHFKARHFIFKMYSDLYDLLVLYNFFKGAKYNVKIKDLDITDFINKLPAIFLTNRLDSENP